MNSRISSGAENKPPFRGLGPGLSTSSLSSTNMMPLSPKHNLANIPNISNSNSSVNDASKSGTTMHTNMTKKIVNPNTSSATSTGAIKGKTNNNSNGNNNSSNNNTNDQIFQLQIEIQSLKQNLKLASSTNKNELLSVLSEKETVIQTKSKQITVLHEKFHKITKAVSQMEHEVSILRKNNTEFESDNKKLKRHLNIREKEVTALVQRCTLQEEKLGEGKSARVLEKQLVEMKALLSKTRARLAEMEALQQTLDRVEQEKKEAYESVETLAKENKTLNVELSETKEEMESKLRESTKAIGTVKEDLERVIKLKEKQEADCARLNSTLNECNIRMSDMNAQMQELREVHDKKVKGLESQVADQAQEHKKQNSQQNEELTKLNDKKEEEIRNLQSDLKERENALASHLKDVAIMKSDKEKVHEALENLQQERDELEAARKEDTSKHHAELKVMTDAVDAKCKDIDTLQKAVASLKESECGSEEEVAVLKDKIVFLGLEAESSHQREEKLKTGGIESAQTIESLKSDIESMEKFTKDIQEKYKEKIAAMEGVQTSMKEEYEGMLLESEDQLKEMDAQFSAERNKVDKLRNEIEQMTVHSTRQEELRQMEMKLLEESVATAKDQSGTKEKDLLAKTLELRNERERATELEASFNILQKSSTQAETKSASIVDEMSNKLQAGTAKCAKLEEERDSIISESRKAVDMLKDKITDLESDFTNLKGEIVSKDSQLDQRQTTIDSLVKAKAELESKILSYRNDLELLMKAYDGTKEEFGRTVKTLEEENQKLNTEKEDDFQSFQDDYQKLQSLASESQSEIDKLHNSNHAVRATLEENTRQIEDLQRSNVELELQMKGKTSKISELQLNLESSFTENDETKKRIAQFKLEKEKEIFRHLDAIEEEKSVRKTAESNLKKLQRNFEIMRKEHESTAEVKAANFLLQDKIDRQEAYLKRKLKKEKVMKERMIAPIPMKSPPKPRNPRRPESERGLQPKQSSMLRSPPPSRSRSITRRPLDVARESAGPRASSLPRPRSRQGDELDRILNGDMI